MRLSIWPNAAQPWNVIAEEVTALEEAGWDGVYIADHFMPNLGDDTEPTRECAALDGRPRRGHRAHAHRLAGVRQHVPSPRGPGQRGRHHRRDERRSGAVRLGAGWQENEHRAYGIELPPPKQRLDRFEEAVQVVKGLFANERFSFKGEYYVIDDAPMSPSRADMKILIGGSGEKRTMRIAAEACATSGTRGRLPRSCGQARGAARDTATRSAATSTTSTCRRRRSSS